MSTIVLIEPPARTSNEYELWRAIPDFPLTVISDRDGWGSADTRVLRSRGLPIVGRLDGWTATPKWLRGLDDLRFDEVACVVTLELFSFCTVQGRRLARRLGVPHVVHVAETMADNPIYRIPPYSTITKRVGIHADAHVCTTERARGHAIALGCVADTVHVVHLAVDTDEFTPRPGGRVDEPHVLFIGSLRADRGVDKGVREVIDACEQVRAEVPDLRLTLLGDGRLRPEIERRAAAAPWMHVRGHLPREEVPTLLRSASVLMLGSKRTWKWEEQFGYALVEAMAAGLPVVSTTSGAIPEVVPDWNPLVDEGDVTAMAGGLARALGAEGGEWGCRNRTAAIERYDIRAQARKLRAAILTVTSDD